VAAVKVPLLENHAPPRRVKVAVVLLGLVAVALGVGAVIRLSTSDDPGDALPAAGSIVLVIGVGLGLWAGERFAWLLTLLISSLQGLLALVQLADAEPWSGAMGLISLRLLAAVVLVGCLGGAPAREYYAR